LLGRRRRILHGGRSGLGGLLNVPVGVVSLLITLLLRLLVSVALLAVAGLLPVALGTSLISVTRLLAVALLILGLTLCLLALLLIILHHWVRAARRKLGVVEGSGRLTASNDA